MNRRNFLKAIAAMVGAAGVPVALVEACQIDAPVPKDWIVALLDRNGNVLAKSNVTSLDYEINLCVETTGVAAFFSVEGADLPGRVVGPILASTNCVCAGGTVCITSLKLEIFSN